MRTGGSRRGSSEGPGQEKLRVYYNDAVIALDILYDLACGGSSGATEVLRVLSEKMLDAAGEVVEVEMLKEGTMKRRIAWLLLFVAMAGSISANGAESPRKHRESQASTKAEKKTVHVKSYKKKNGTVVQAHTRRPPKSKE